MRILALIVCLISFQNSFAWGAKGHKIVAVIAESNISKQVADSVKYYLSGTTFEEASTWMDQIRDDHSNDHLKPAHYINIEKDKTYVKVKGTNIMNELDIVLLALQKKATKEAVNLALKELFHLIGDLHQPLHAGFANDKGGNTIEIIFNGKKTNLHRLWDSDIIENAKNIQGRSVIASMTLLNGKESLSDAVDLNKWLSDSRSLLDEVYSFQNRAIDEKYIVNAEGNICLQLGRAGIRLANVLNKYFT